MAPSVPAESNASLIDEDREAANKRVGSQKQEAESIAQPKFPMYSKAAPGAVLPTTPSPESTWAPISAPKTGFGISAEFGSSTRFHLVAWKSGYSSAS